MSPLSEGYRRPFSRERRDRSVKVASHISCRNKLNASSFISTFPVHLHDVLHRHRDNFNFSCVFFTNY
jgi:hypothetical protein